MLFHFHFHVILFYVTLFSYVFSTQFSHSHILAYFELLCFRDNSVMVIFLQFIALLWFRDNSIISISFNYFALLFLETIQLLPYSLIISYCCAFDIIQSLPYPFLSTYWYVFETIQSWPHIYRLYGSTVFFGTIQSWPFYFIVSYSRQFSHCDIAKLFRIVLFSRQLSLCYIPCLFHVAVFFRNSSIIAKSLACFVVLHFAGTWIIFSYPLAVFCCDVFKIIQSLPHSLFISYFWVFKTVQLFPCPVGTFICFVFVCFLAFFLLFDIVMYSR